MEVSATQKSEVEPTSDDSLNLEQPTAFILKLFEMINGAPDEVIAVSEFRRTFVIAAILPVNHARKVSNSCHEQARVLPYSCQNPSRQRLVRNVTVEVLFFANLYICSMKFTLHWSDEAYHIVDTLVLTLTSDSEYFTSFKYCLRT
jgi:hypothetical protein